MRRHTIPDTPVPTSRPGIRSILLLPFERQTWRHILFALFLPLTLASILAIQSLMKAAQDHGRPQLGPLILMAALAVAAAVGPRFERMRVRVFFGRAVPPRPSARLAD